MGHAAGRQEKLTTDSSLISICGGGYEQLKWQAGN